MWKLFRYLHELLSSLLLLFCLQHPNTFPASAESGNEITMKKERNKTVQRTNNTMFVFAKFAFICIRILSCLKFLLCRKWNAIIICLNSPYSLQSLHVWMIFGIRQNIHFSNLNSGQKLIRILPKMNILLRDPIYFLFLQ